MKPKHLLKPLFKRILSASLPAAIPLATVGAGCDLNDVFDVVRPVEEFFSEEELDTLCGDLEFSDCDLVCTEVINRLNQSEEPLTLCEAGDNCNISDCLPQPDRQLRLTCDCSYEAGRRPAGLASEGTVVGE
ncbi:MAG: hypothetical protein AAFS10_04225, partial [Myxococcota bacterium]